MSSRNQIVSAESHLDEKSKIVSKDGTKETEITVKSPANKDLKPRDAILENVELALVKSHASGMDMPVEQPLDVSQHEMDVYSKFSPRRKIAMVTVLSFASFLSPMAGTAVLSAVPEVAATFHTTGTYVFQHCSIH